MPWYIGGTVTVANGSSIVIGDGTDFVANAQIGHAFLGPDGKLYEIIQVEAAGKIVLRGPYLGGSGGGQGYAIMPTSSFARDLALGAAQLLNTFATVRDTVGQGLFPDGTVAAPGIRFGADQDTGFYRSGTNELSIATGGVARLTVAGGNVAVGGSLGGFEGIAIAGQGNRELRVGQAPDRALIVGWKYNADLTSAYGFIETFAGNHNLALQTAGGNLLVGGATAGVVHVIRKVVAEGSTILAVENGLQGVAFCSVNQAGASGAGAAMLIGRNSSTGRSINAAGTVNASGADYAEYMTKAAGCGTIDKGDVCGVDSDGRLTKMWATAISFVIKSTDPSYVGGDVWGQSIGPRPEGPGDEPAPPRTPPAAPPSEDEAAVEAWQAVVAAYPAQLAAYHAAHDAWATAKAAYDTALPAWEAALETERQKVDRIAFSGQVPVNVSGDFAVGDYLIAAASGSGIRAVAVPADTITFDQYRRRLGKVWAVRNGRAWVDVQHG